MNIRAVDKAVGSVFREFGKGDITPEARRKLEARFHKALGKRQVDSQEVLIRAFEQIRYHWHEPSRLQVEDYAQTVRELLEHALMQASAGAFLACLDSFVTCDLEAIGALAPNESCIEAWLKARRANKKAIQKAVAAQPVTYFRTAFADWYVKKAPLKTVVVFGRLALLRAERPNHLPPSRQLLVAILRRDKKSVLSDALVREAIHSNGATSEIISAAMASRKYIEPLARSFGYALADLADESITDTVVGVLGANVQAEDSVQASVASLFAAHVATTWGLAHDAKKTTSTEDRLLDLATTVLVKGQAAGQPNLWLACQAGILIARLLVPAGKVSAQGALQVALALRAAQSGADPVDALWSAAFNVGIREIGQQGDAMSFDPQLHEDIRGGLLRGENARIVKCGWEFDGQILVRAEVEPT